MTSRLFTSSLHLLITLSALSVPAATAPGLWTVVIDQSPAPPPDKGPPLSANAVRDPAQLPYELIAIFGSYIVAVTVVGIAILILGRRRRALLRPGRKTTGMEKPLALTGDRRPPFKPSPIDPSQSTKLFGPSPVSPSKFWASPNLSLKHGWDTVARRTSKRSGAASIVTVESTAEDDRTRNEIEMDRLYAAVADHETAKELGIDMAELQHIEQNPPELQHLRHGIPVMTAIPPQQTGFGASYPTPVSTASPQQPGRQSKKKPIPSPISVHHTANSSRSSTASRSFRNYNISPPMGSPDLMPDHNDIYSEAEPLTPRAYNPGPPPVPPMGSLPTSTTPLQSPIYTSSQPIHQLATYRRENEQRRVRQVLASPSPYDPRTSTPHNTHFSPIIRSSRATSFATANGVGPRSPHSPPLSARSPEFPRSIAEEQDKAFTASLSPRRHAHKASYASGQSDIRPGFEFALDPELADSGSAGSSPTKSMHSNTDASVRSRRHGTSEVGSRSATPKYKRAAPTLTITTGKGSTNNLNSAGTAHGGGTSASTMASTSTLPFRAALLPLRGMALISPTSGTRPTSMIRATVLDRPTKNGGRLGTGGLPPTTPGGTVMQQQERERAAAGGRGNTGLLRAPGTAGLAPPTPYSPFYMPQTPLTPMTPSRLITREERRQRQKEENRNRGQITEEDVVKEEGELWGDGY